MFYTCEKAHKRMTENSHRKHQITVANLDPGIRNDPREIHGLETGKDSNRKMKEIWYPDEQKYTQGTVQKQPTTQWKPNYLLTEKWYKALNI